MKYFTPFRLAAYLALLFCAGHTLGGMLARGTLGDSADAVFATMRSTHFVFNGADCTWYGFWFGFGLMVSALLVLVALTAFVLDRVTADAWPQVAPIAWGLVATMLANSVIAWRYFFAGPVVFSVVILLLLVVGLTRKNHASRTSLNACR